jgi:hypothetical protein
VAPPTVPVPASVAPDATVTAPVANDESPSMRSVPACTAVGPRYVLTPERPSVPVPIFVSPPPPPSVMADANVTDWPLLSITAPPGRTVTPVAARRVPLLKVNAAAAPLPLEIRVASTRPPLRLSTAACEKAPPPMRMPEVADATTMPDPLTLSVPLPSRPTMNSPPGFV